MRTYTYYKKWINIIFKQYGPLFHHPWVCIAQTLNSLYPSGGMHYTCLSLLISIKYKEEPVGIQVKLCFYLNICFLKLVLLLFIREIYCSNLAYSISCWLSICAYERKILMKKICWTKSLRLLSYICEKHLEKKSKCWP